MEDLKFEQTNELPGIHLDKSQGIFLIEGRSIPRNAADFYKSVIEWMDEYALNPNPETNFEFRLDYFNTLSQKYVADVLKVLDKMKKAGHNVTVVWAYMVDDEDMMHIGQEFEHFLSLKFVFKIY